MTTYTQYGSNGLVQARDITVTPQPDGTVHVGAMIVSADELLPSTESDGVERIHHIGGAWYLVADPTERS